MCVAEEMLDRSGTGALQEEQGDYNPNNLQEISEEELDQAYKELMMLFPQIESREQFTYSVVVAAYIFWSHNESDLVSHKSIQSFLASMGMYYASSYDDAPSSLDHATEIMDYLLKPFAAMRCAVFFKKRYWSPEAEEEKDIFTAKTWEQIHQTCVDAIASDNPNKREYQYLAACVEAHIRGQNAA